MDTGQAAPQTADFSQTGPGTIDTDEVDPVAEADVYMAYGRDAQAEEILLEAMQKDPQRLAIHAKLLEIYANRKSVKQFETLASELYAQTGGAGPEWEKVAGLGAKLDPGNPLYTTGRASVGGAAEFDADATMVASAKSADVMRSTLTLPVGALGQMAEKAGSETAPLPTSAMYAGAEATVVKPLQEVAPPAAAAGDELMSLDFDLGPPAAQPAAAPAADEEEDAFIDTVTKAEANVVDFNLEHGPVATAEPPPPEPEMLDFDLGFGPGSGAPADDHQATHKMMVDAPATAAAPKVDDFSLDLPAAAATVVAPQALDINMGAAMRAEDTVVNPMALTQDEGAKVDDEIVDIGAVDADALEFDVQLTDSTILGQPLQAPSFDMGSINLDLAAEAAPAAAPAAPAAAPAPAAADDSIGVGTQWEAVSTKLDLAKAYEEMGDLEGARELLQEVLSEGSPALAEQAQAILARIGG